MSEQPMVEVVTVVDEYGEPLETQWVPASVAAQWDTRSWSTSPMSAGSVHWAQASE